MEKNPIEHAEDGGARSNSEGKSEDCDQAEARGFEENAESVAKIVRHFFELILRLCSPGECHS
jgi:hypothetical protein